MTGRYNYRTRAIDTYLGRAMMEPAEVTAAEAFSAAGYRTGIFGKWHLGDNYPMRAMDQGFEESLVHQGGGLAQPAGHPDGYHYFDPMLRHNGAWERHKGYCTDIFAGACERFIAAGRGKPFFRLPLNQRSAHAARDRGVVGRTVPGRGRRRRYRAHLRHDRQSGCGRGLHRPLRRGGAQRAGDGQLH